MVKLLIKINNNIIVTSASLLEHPLLSASAIPQKFTFNMLKAADKREMQNLRSNYKEKRKEGRGKATS